MYLVEVRAIFLHLVYEIGLFSASLAGMPVLDILYFRSEDMQLPVLLVLGG